MFGILNKCAVTAGRSGLAALTVLCVGLVLASAAAAATATIGPLDVSNNQASVGGSDMTFAQVTQPTASVLLSAPADGVIIAWHVHGDTQMGGGKLALRVLRPTGPQSFTGVATSDPVTAVRDDGNPAHVVSIPVRAGDYIGVDAIGDRSQVPVIFITQPPGASIGSWSPILADATASNPNFSSSGRLQLNAVEALQPAVSGVSPSSGSTAGGQAVTISGSNLDGATAVSFGGTPASSFSAVSPTQITATAPAHSAGTVDVQVTSPGGASPASGADAYTYLAPAVTPPAIAISAPANGGTYTQGQAVNAAYSCSAPAGATLTSCSGPAADGAAIDTQTPGSHTFTVTAHDSDGGSASRSALYTVTAASPPSISITSPSDGGTYAQGQAVNAAYSCSAPAGAAVTSCLGSVADGAPIDTQTAGLHTFTVTVQDNDGGSATTSVSYTVLAAATSPTAPTITAASQTAAAWRENDTLPHVSAKNRLPVGTTFSFALNEPATVKLSFMQQATGRRVHGECLLHAKKSGRSTRCTRSIAAGTLTFAGDSGLNELRFAGRISPTNKLTPGHYTLRILATDARGRRSAPRALNFTVVK